MFTRRRIIVPSSFQKWFIIRIIFYRGIFALAFGMGLILWFNSILDQLSFAIEPVNPDLVKNLFHQMHLGYWVMGVFLLLLICISSVQALLFGRQIAGPIHQIHRRFQKFLETNEWRPVELRKDDLFRDLAEDVNQTMLKHNGKKGSH